MVETKRSKKIKQWFWFLMLHQIKYSLSYLKWRWTRKEMTDDWIYEPHPFHSGDWWEETLRVFDGDVNKAGRFAMDHIDKRENKRKEVES